MTNLDSKLQTLPQKPGVYVFKNNRGEVLYVGKAKNLKKRVKSYFVGGLGIEPRLLIMKQNIADLDYTVVSSEMESLMLENNLIKQYQPRFNVLMRDDKNYQFIKIDYGTQIPQIYTVRKITPASSPPIPRGGAGGKREGVVGKSKFFGPYTSGLSVKETLRLIRDIFHLCRNKKISERPCFAYHLGRCPGVCTGKINLNEYKKTFREIEEFLKHRQTAVLKHLKTGMAKAARQRRFEQAAATRNKIRSLEHLWQRQKIVSAKNENHDYLGIYAAAKEAVVCLFMVREGRLIHTEHFGLEHADSPVPEILERFIINYYTETSDLPKAICLPAALPNKTLLENNWHLKLRVPARGRKHGLVKLAAENAALYYERELASFEKNLSHVLAELQKLLHLPTRPTRIEGFDISNLQGTNPVGSMVVFTDGKPDKSQYRKFKINIKETPDDFAMMREMLERRFKRSSSVILRYPEGSHEILRRSAGWRTPQNDNWRIPDLIIVDGGKGQLNVAVAVLKNYNLNIPVMGLAKRLEEIFLPGRKEPIVLPPDNPVLFLLQRIRDEAHRFAITFYRSRHRKAQSYSRLQDVAGIGPVSRKKLLKKFGNVSAIRTASLAAIAATVGPAMAKKIKEQL